MIRWQWSLQQPQTRAKPWQKQTTASVNGDYFTTTNSTVIYCHLKTFSDLTGSANRAFYYCFCVRIILVRKHYWCHFADFRNSENDSDFGYGLFECLIDYYSSTFSLN